MKIGIFDSGIGGLSVLYELAARLPDAEFIYFADSENAPYGEKTADKIRSLTESAVDFLAERGAVATVLACNTATAAAAKYLREKYPDRRIFGMEPAVNEAAKKIKEGRILATATPLTLGAEKYHALLGKTGAEKRTVSLPLPSLVRLAERELFDEARNEVSGAEEYVKEMLATLDTPADEITAIVLGCTHFTYFADVFRKLLPDRPIYNGVGGTASHVINTLALTPSVSGERPDAPDVLCRTEIYISGISADEKAKKGVENCLSLLSKMTF